MTLKQKLKSFFKARESSDEAVELLKKFIIPFSRNFKRVGVDDVLAAFFAVDDRNFVYVKATRDFKMPGKYYVAGNRPIYGLGPRQIKKNQTLLMAIDRQDGTARIEAVVDSQPRMFLLEKFEFITIKDWVKPIG